MNVVKMAEERNLRLGVLPDTTITSHVNMKLVCHTINLFWCEPTVAEHANLHK